MTSLFKTALRGVLKQGAPDVLKAGHPLLRAKGEAVRPQDIASSKFKTIVGQINAILDSPLHPVLGLAASQVGHPIRLIAFQITDSQTLREKHIDKPVPRTFIVNPEMTILDKTPPEQWPIDYEFCESIPGYSGLVRRANHIYVKGLDLEGKPMIMSVKGFVARVVQHEMDHLNGELFVDKMERQSFRHDDYVDKYEMFKK